jgi:hydroxyethylthiazole kinase
MLLLAPLQGEINDIKSKIKPIKQFDMTDKKQLMANLVAVRQKSPLVHNITNYVVMNNTANALLAIGASPVMAHATDEVKDMVAIASSLVINMGTLSEKWVEAMLIAGKAAHEKGIPVVFDPVGVGATPYRNHVAASIVNICKPSIIRGNASEIMSLARENTTTKGVDSTASSNAALDAAKRLAKETGAVVVISGEEDFITDGQTVRSVKNGSALMPRVTGMGCTATAMIGAFAAVNSDLLAAATHAMTVMGVAGEIAAQKAEGPGSLQLYFLDALYNLTGEVLAERAKIA